MVRTIFGFGDVRRLANLSLEQTAAIIGKSVDFVRALERQEALGNIKPVVLAEYLAFFNLDLVLTVVNKTADDDLELLSSNQSIVVNVTLTRPILPPGIPINDKEVPRG